MQVRGAWQSMLCLPELVGRRARQGNGHHRTSHETRARGVLEMCGNSKWILFAKSSHSTSNIVTGSSLYFVGGYTRPLTRFHVHEENAELYGISGSKKLVARLERILRYLEDAVVAIGTRDGRSTIDYALFLAGGALYGNRIKNRE